MAINHMEDQAVSAEIVEKKIVQVVIMIVLVIVTIPMFLKGIVLRVMGAVRIEITLN